MNDPEAAFAGYGDGQTGLSDGIHGRADNGNVDLDVARKPRAHVHFNRQNLRLGRNQHNVIIGQSQAWFLIEHIFPSPDPQILVAALMPFLTVCL